MANPFKSPVSNHLGLLLVRVPLGLLFCIRGYQKLATIGLAGFVSAHVKQVPRYVPAWFPSVYLHTLPFAEMALGALVIVGLLTRVSGFLLSLLLISFLMIFGGYDTAGTWPFSPNFFFLGIALLLLLVGSGGLAVDARLFGGKGSSSAMSKGH
jgi:uncharacterized membrane protein YphA (DoxX/SURF4 family)